MTMISHRVVGMGRASDVANVARGPCRPGRGGRPGRLRSSIAAAAALAVSGCAATQSAAAVETGAPGFWLGVWHGFIFPVAWIVSLFVHDVAIYAVPNSGGWYDFGYFVGIVFIGIGARSGRTVYRDRVVRVRER